ncbi:MAG TPA: protein phosphatase 2C domain-containing protein [Nocardioidaceae bacterium]|nr:protein phosphatase 2C domain-containing protein [Nocardioidaceae bacterium]
MEYVAVTALTHEGLVREHNEDSMVVGPWTTCASVTQTPETLFFPLEDPLLVAVADGLGGHSAGEVASTVVVQELARSGRTVDDEASLREVLDGCNQAIYDAATREPAWAGMGTTVAGLLVSDTFVRVFNVGDSRVYALDDDGLSQLSVDDNPPLAPGQTHTSVLTQTMGGHPGRQRVEAHVSTRNREAGCRYLVCTDGLSDVVDPEAITDVLRAHRGGQAVYELWRAAIDGGGPDNITILTVEFGSR